MNAFKKYFCRTFTCGFLPAPPESDEKQKINTYRPTAFHFTLQLFVYAMYNFPKRGIFKLLNVSVPLRMKK